MICNVCNKRGGEATDKCPFCNTPYDKSSKEKFSSDFVHFMNCEALYDFHIKNIDLDFDMDAVERMRIDRGIIEKQTDTVVFPDSMDEQQTDVVSEQLVNEKALSRFFVPKKEEKSEGKEQDISDTKQEVPLSDKATEQTEQEMHDSDLSQPRSKSRIFWKMLIGGCFLVFLFLVVRYAVFYISVWQPFREHIENGEYTQAAAIYDSCESPFFRDKADALLYDGMEIVLTQYKNGDIPGKEAKEKLDGLAIIGNAENQDELVAVYNDAVEVEQSRAAYKEGLAYFEAGEYAKAMESWSKVSEKDDVSYNAMQNTIGKFGVVDRIKNAIVENAGKTKDQILQDLLYLQSVAGDRRSLSNLIEGYQEELLQEQESIHGNGIAGGAISDEDESVGFTSDIVVNKDSPILISEINVSRPTSNGSINLIIDWTNRSGREISRIVFYVQPLSEYGHTLSCRKGGYSLYYAIDEGPYQNGEGTPSDTWMWRDAWYNSLIKQVNLLQVVIDYADGERLVISDASAIHKLYS